MWLIALAGCGPDEARAPIERSDETGQTEDLAPGIVLGDVARLEPAAGAQNHATIAALPDGETLLAAHDDAGLRIVGPEADLSLAVPPPSWPQVSLYAEGSAVFASGPEVTLQPLVGEPVPLGLGRDAFYPDLARIGDDALIVWSELDQLRLVPLDGLTPGPDVVLPLRTGWQSGPMTLRPAPGGALLAWSELADTFMEVYVAPVTPAGVVGEPVVIDRVEDSIGGRPSLAVRDDGAFAVTWRAWPDTPDQRAWLATYDADGTRLAGPVQLGGRADRAVLVPTGDLVLAAWVETDGGTWVALQLFDWAANPVGDVVRASDGPLDDRPFVDLVGGAGWMCWEADGDVLVRSLDVTSAR